jgi:hypothetical protein
MESLPATHRAHPLINQKVQGGKTYWKVEMAVAHIQNPYATLLLSCSNDCYRTTQSLSQRVNHLCVMPNAQMRLKRGGPLYLVLSFRLPVDRHKPATPLAECLPL